MSGADKNKKNDLGRVCGDVLKMPGGNARKKGHKMADLCPFYVPFFRTGLKINVQIQKVTRTNNVQRAIFSAEKMDINGT